MEPTLGKTKSNDIILRKIFDIKMKQGHEIKKAYVDESDFLRTFYFLKGNRVYVFDISTRKLDELEFTRGKEVSYITGNSSRDYLIVVLKDGKIYAIDCNQWVKHIKNLYVTSWIFDNQKGKDKEMNFENFKLFASQSLDKMVLANENMLVIWYQSDIAGQSTQTKKSRIGELGGTFYNISLESEKKVLLPQEALSSQRYIESLIAVFHNNYFLGSFCRILYVLLIPINNNIFKIILVDYLFRFDLIDKFRASSEDFESSATLEKFPNKTECVRNIEKKSLYSFLHCPWANLSQVSGTNINEKIILSCNKSGNCCAIAINFPVESNNRLIFYMTETYRFSSIKLISLFTQEQSERMNDSKLPIVVVEDIEWICNDLFLVVLLSQGYFFILNLNFQVIEFVDNSNSLVTHEKFEFMSCPSSFEVMKLKNTDRLQLISFITRTDYFIIYSNNCAICFQSNYKNFELRILSPNSNDTFDDFLYVLKYYQVYFPQTDSESNGLFEKIHQFLVKTMKELYEPEHGYSMASNANSIISYFVKFIRIFRTINQLHETNLTVLAYFIEISHNFFMYLINHKEIWLAFIFINVCEAYLLKLLRLKPIKNKLDQQIAKGQTSYLVFNTYHQHNISLKCYNKIINRVLHSRLRLLLLFLALMEFRNNQALNINVLYFVLAKMCINKLKKHNLLDDVQQIVKVVIRNWKFLKTENQRAGSEEYILNSLSMNQRTELLSQFLHNRVPREDIKFDFFGEFYSIDDLQNFVETNESYCRGEEEALINEYNYFNNVGVLQKWILFFTNYFYMFLFEDIKSYLDNHLKQYHSSNKPEGNISPEEKNLSSLIYFNINFFFLCICNHLKFFLKYMTMKYDYSNDSSLDDTKILDDFNRVVVPFISPIDIPFIIFEFSTTEDNIQRRNLPFEINQNLNCLIVRYSKQYNFTLADSLDFIEFLEQCGFCYFPENVDIEDEPMELNRGNKIQRFMYSALLFYIFTVHKLNLVHCIETNQELIFAVVDSLNTKLKKEIYEFLFIVMNGMLKSYLRNEALSKPTSNEARYIEVILTQLKFLFYKILREEPPQVRKDIHEYVNITPSAMKPYLLEGALFYEYKNFNKLIKNELLNFSDVVNHNNFDKIFKVTNIFEAMIKDSSHVILDIIFNQNKTITDMQAFHTDFVISLNNLLLLTKIFDIGTHSSSDKDKDKEYLIFSIENNRDFIRKFIYSSLTQKAKGDFDEKAYQENIASIFDKLIKGNFDTKFHFQFSNIELKNKMVRSMKTVIAKILHLLNVLLIKHKMLVINPQTDMLGYLKMVAYCLILEQRKRHAFEWSMRIIEYLLTVNWRNIKFDNDKANACEILRMLHIVYLKSRKNLYAFPQVADLEEKIKQENKDIFTKYKLFINEELGKIRDIIEQTRLIKSTNLRNFIISCYSDLYIEITSQVFSHIFSYAVNTPAKVPMKRARKLYIGYCDSFYKLTGIPPKHSIDFGINWELVDNDVIYQCIVTDDNIDIATFKKDDSANDLKHSLFMNRRQKFGCDTPKRRNMNIQFPRDTSAELTVERSSSLRSSNRSDSASSIDIREENSHALNKETYALKLKKKMKKDLIAYTNKSISVHINTNEEDESNFHFKTNAFLNKIIRVFFRRFVNGIFLQFKKNISGKELEEIKLICVKPKEAIVDMLVLRERLISIKELVKPNQDISISAEIRQKSERRNEEDFGNLKPFDIINVNKFKAGRSEDSEVYKELKEKKGRKIHETIKTKLKEMKDKLSRYEEMLASLGKEMISSLNK